MRCATKDDKTGTQCRRQAVREIIVHGADVSPGWWWVPVCLRHFPDLRKEYWRYIRRARAKGARP